MVRLSFPDTCPGIVKLVRPTPESITCPKCKRTLEIWSDEKETVCDGCGAKVSREMGTLCLEYCDYADKCREIISRRAARSP
ncbi:phosphohydrolase [Candidatus Bathyarchaeota archaeon]|nr:phosphohydrolase [Candidatus Bathyarchaeota archaeon]MBS7628484.1 phosphohydrolase [Candidatus Bathyarchaeota archaeon]